MNMNIIFDNLKLIEELAKHYEIKDDKNASFYRVVSKNLKEEILNKSFDNSIEQEILEKVYNYISLLQIENLELKIKKFLYANISLLEKEDCLLNWYEEVKRTEVLYGDYDELINNLPNITLNQIGFMATMLFLEKLLSLISYIDNNNYLLMKYNAKTYIYGHNNLTKLTRGIIVDVSLMKIVSFPFHKFFNLNETVETSYEKVKELEKNAKYKSSLIKEDGSTICCTKLENNEILITTNGAFENEQIDKAKYFFKTKYNYFIENMEYNKSYILEIIYPENRIVVDYSNEEKMILLAVRDLTNYNLLDYSEISKIADNLKLEAVSEVPFTSLENFIENAENLKEANLEGWIIRLKTDNQDLMVKIKLKEYVEAHRAVFTKINVFKIFKLRHLNVLDDIIANSNGELLEKILLELDRLNYIETVIQAEIDAECKKIYDLFGIDKKSFIENRYKRKSDGIENFLNCLNYMKGLYNTTPTLIVKGVFNSYSEKGDFDEFFNTTRHKGIRAYLVERNFLNKDDLEE